MASIIHRVGIKAPASQVYSALSTIDGLSSPPDWLGTEIVFELSVEEPYTVVLFSHNKWRDQDASMAHCSTKWATFLLSLKELIESGKGKPAPDDVKIDNWN